VDETQHSSLSSPVFVNRTPGIRHASALSARMTARTRVQIARWLGEFFREAAVLIAVLGPMELAVQNGLLTVRQWTLIVVLTAVCMAVGVHAGLKNAHE